MTFAARILLAEMLRQACGIVLPITLVLAPWLFGGTRAWAADILTVMLATAGGCWLVASVLDPRGGALPLTLAASTLWLIVISAVVTALRPAFPADPFMVEQFRGLRAVMPGAFVDREPWLVWRFIASALLATLAVADLARDWRWWRVFCETSIAAGASIALLGLVQIIFHAPAVLWDATFPAANERFFGPFFHSSPAGAYLDLTWPLALASVLGEYRNFGAWARRRPIFWWHLTAAALGLIALFCQTARTAQVLGVGILVLLCLAARWLPQRDGAHDGRSARWPWPVWLGLAGVTIAALLWLPLFSETRARWQEFSPGFGESAPALSAPPVVWDSTGRGDRIIESNSPTRGEFAWDRRLAWGTALRMIAARPWLGYGLGGWSDSYHHFTNDPFLKTFIFYLQFAHQEYLQTVVEWGLLGAFGWAVLVVGGLRAGVLSLSWVGADPAVRLKTCAILFSLGALSLYACLDFPLEIPAVQLQALVLLGLLWSGNGRSPY